METAVKKFARRILAIHLALFLGVAALVLFASHEIYNSALLEAMHQAEGRQTLLAQQTTDGIESYYNSIFGDLSLLGRAQPEGEASGVQTPLGRLSVALRPSRALNFAPLIARQLEGRVSQVFLIEPGRSTQPRVLAQEDLNEKTRSLRRAEARTVADAFGPWLAEVDGPAISPFKLIDGQAMNIVAVPIGEPPARLLVAVAPLQSIERTYLNKLQREAIGAFLVDDQQTIMVSSRPRLVGQNVGELADERVKTAMIEWQKQGFRGTKSFGEPVSIGTEKLEPVMVTAQPLKVGARTWHLFVLSRLSDADAAVTDLFQQTIIWGLFVAVSLCAILISTSVQLIRGRIRLERVRAEMLTRELGQARQIQLAWLPTKRIAGNGRHVAAVNYPAQHISGDFYNWFELPDSRLAVVIGDVTGHGMSAAFLMATAQLLVRNTLPRFTEPGEALAEVNRQLCVQVFNGQFVTLQVLIIDAAGCLRIATAGHPPPLVCDDEDRGFYVLPLESQLPLGVHREASFPTERFELGTQASLVLYTDGVPEALAPNGARLCLDGLLKGLGNPPDTADALLERVVTVVNNFRGTVELEDDLTVVTVQLEREPAPRPLAAQSA